MKIRKPLLDLARVIADQAERDPVFAEQIIAALGLKEHASPKAEPKRSGAARPKNRRPAAVLDPVALARDGEAALRSGLSPLSVEQLKDVVADYGMDPGKLVMKWKDADRRPYRGACVGPRPKGRCVPFRLNREGGGDVGMVQEAPA